MHFLSYYRGYLMHRYFFLFFLGAFNLPSLASLPIMEMEDNEIELGGVLYHLRELTGVKSSNYGRYGIRNYLKPFFIVSHKGWLAGYFENSHHGNSYVVGMRRYWPSTKFNSYNLVPGFAVGMATGYCKGKGSDIYDNCSNNRKWRVVPYGQLFLRLKKDNVSLNLGYSFVLTYLTASYYFN